MPLFAVCARRLLAAAGDHTLAVEAQAPRRPGHPGITYELLSSEDGVLGHWSCV